MKTLRTYMVCCLFLVSVFVSGCATTATYEQQMREREEKAAWDQLPFCDKAAYYTALYLQWALYAAGSSLAH